MKLIIEYTKGKGTKEMLKSIKDLLDNKISGVNIGENSIVSVQIKQ